MDDQPPTYVYLLICIHRRGDLTSILHKAVKSSSTAVTVRQGAEVIDVLPSSSSSSIGSLTVKLKGGEEVEGDVFVAADGMFSR